MRQLREENVIETTQVGERLRGTHRRTRYLTGSPGLCALLLYFTSQKGHYQATLRKRTFVDNNNSGHVLKLSPKLAKQCTGHREN